MAGQNQTTGRPTANTQTAGVSKIDALYSWLLNDLQKLKKELLNEMKYSSAQIGSLYGEVKADNEKSSKAISQEIRYSYIQNQNIYDGLSANLADVVAKIDETIARLDSFASEELAEGVKEKVATVLPPIQETLDEIKYSYLQHESIYESLKTLISENVVTKMDETNARFSLVEQMDETLEEMRQKIADLSEWIEAADHKNLVDQIVAAMPVPENVDYVRISDEVGDKVLEVLGDVLVQQPETEETEEKEAKIDYDRIIYGTTEKVIESLPYPDKVDYTRIEDAFMTAANKVQTGVSEDVIASAIATAVANALSNIDMDVLAENVAEKLQTPAAAPEIDYEKLADMVAAKIAANTANEEEETSFELVLDEEGVDAIATSVSMKLCDMCANCAPVEELAEETVEEPIAEPVEETVEEPVEEPVEEKVVAEKESEYEEVGGELIDTETGLVVRLKRSFTAKMCQSDDDIKGYYNELKNALLCYKKVRANVSWHGDRFNYGRETIAKMSIHGKTLGLYLALDPTDEEQFKPTVYHQRNVGDQRAHESTPFMVKIKSGAAVKKALRLIEALAVKFEAEREEDIETADFTVDFPMTTTKELLKQGHIKMTKEKKVEFNF